MMIGEIGLEEALVSEGFELTTQNPDVVVVGIDRSITYEKLAAASLAIRAGAHFIATNGDRAFPTEKGLVPGNGSFVKLLESTTDRTAIYVGKPEPHMLHFIQQKGYTKDEMVMIGDNYETDIQAGIRFGIDTIHVEGGVTSLKTVMGQLEHRHLCIRALQIGNNQKFRGLASGAGREKRTAINAVLLVFQRLSSL